VQDEIGPVCYVLLTDNGDGLVRCAVQFAPEKIVCKARVKDGLTLAGIPAMAIFAKDNGFKGLIYESVSPTLIRFCKALGFDRDMGNSEYAMFFEG